MSNLKKVYLLTGANLGNRFETLTKARILLSDRVGCLGMASSFYETDAWGNEDQPDFLNQALELETLMSPSEVLEAALDIEKILGRVRTTKWTARIIDIDLLFYADKIIDRPGLSIPHPHLHQRNFVLVPMLEIAPDLQHPVLKKTIEELYLESKDPLDVRLVEKPHAEERGNSKHIEQT